MSKRDLGLIILAALCVVVAGVLIYFDRNAEAIGTAIGAAIGRLSGANDQGNPS